MKKMNGALLFSGLGILLSVLIQRYFEVPNFLVAALVGLFSSFLPEAMIYKRKEAVAAVYTGAFASMCSVEVLNSNLSLLVLAVLTGVSFYFFSFVFRGFGGKLGTAAFCASLLLFFSVRLF